MTVTPVSPIAAVLGVIGVAAAARVLASEWRRVNAELHPETDCDGPVRDLHAPTLRRDPLTGVYRVG